GPGGDPGGGVARRGDTPDGDRARRAGRGTRDDRPRDDLPRRGPPEPGVEGTVTHPIRGLALPAALAAAALAGCSRPAPEPPAEGPPVATASRFFVSADSLAAAQAGPGTVVLHVARERTGYDAEHIPGARFLPLGAIVVERDGVPNEL